MAIPVNLGSAGAGRDFASTQAHTSKMHSFA